MRYWTAPETAAGLTSSASVSSSGRHPTVGVGEQLGEDPRREAWHTGLGEDVAEPLDVGSDRSFVALGHRTGSFGLLDWSPYPRVISFSKP